MEGMHLTRTYSTVVGKPLIEMPCTHNQTKARWNSLTTEVELMYKALLQLLTSLNWLGWSLAKSRERSFKLYKAVCLLIMDSWASLSAFDIASNSVTRFKSDSICLNKKMHCSSFACLLSCNYFNYNS